MTDMKHLEFLRAVADEDVRVLLRKESTYMGSWKRRGGVGAFMMLARKWDRLEGMLGADGTHTGKYDVFAHVQLQPSGEDGTALAEIRDLRQYLTLVEAEMMARGAVARPEEPPAVVNVDTLFFIFDGPPGPRSPCLIEVENAQGHSVAVGKWSRRQSDHWELRLDVPVSIEPHRSTLARGDDIEKDFYQLRAQEWGVEPEAARKIIECELAPYRPATGSPGNPVTGDYRGNDIVEVYSVGETGSSGGGSSSVGPGTPEDGGQHAAASPWVVRDNGMLVLTSDVRLAAYVRRGENLFLEPHLTRVEMDVVRKGAPALVGLYRPLNGEYVIDPGHLPAEWRDSWPRLRDEVNATEHAALPAWQRALYGWIEGETKYRIAEDWRAWVA